MEERFASVDYFAVLGLTQSANEDEIRTAFRKLALLHHPDKATYDKEDAKRKFQGIAEAYEVLKDPDLRARFLRVRQGRRPGGDRRPSGGGSGRSSGSSSIAGLRRAGVNAMRQQEREAQAAKEREIAAAQRAEQRRYDSLKESIKSRLLAETGADAVSYTHLTLPTIYSV